VNKKMDVNDIEKKERKKIIENLIKNEGVASAYTLKSKLNQMGYNISWRLCKQELNRVQNEIESQLFIPSPSILKPKMPVAISEKTFKKLEKSYLKKDNMLIQEYTLKPCGCKRIHPLQPNPNSSVYCQHCHMDYDRKNGIWFKHIRKDCDRYNTKFM
jgi:hypothetical protein